MDPLLLDLIGRSEAYYTRRNACYKFGMDLIYVLPSERHFLYISASLGHEGYCNLKIVESIGEDEICMKKSEPILISKITLLDVMKFINGG